MADPPNNSNSQRRLITNVAGILTAAAILGAWGFAATRASSDDVDAVDRKVEKVDAKQEVLRKQLNDHITEQAEFRGKTKAQLDAILRAVK